MAHVNPLGLNTQGPYIQQSADALAVQWATGNRPFVQTTILSQTPRFAAALAVAVHRTLLEHKHQDAADQFHDALLVAYEESDECPYKDDHQYFAAMYGHLDDRPERHRPRKGNETTR